MSNTFEMMSTRGTKRSRSNEMKASPKSIGKGHVYDTRVVGQDEEEGLNPSLMTERQQLAFLLRKTAPVAKASANEQVEESGGKRKSPLPSPKDANLRKGRMKKPLENLCCVCSKYTCTTALFICSQCDKKYPTQKKLGLISFRKCSMPRITLELLRKRSEHNEGIISTLEEISLHQEELEKIELIGTLCRKLRILYLQNNIIEKIEDLTHMKELRYLNLALNNIKRIEGLSNCEFLEKLDLTVNFIDLDELQDSINHLKPLEHLKELYMLGNPAQSDWPGFTHYVVASLPRLQSLDGKEISRSDRIIAMQNYPKLKAELEQLVLAKRAKELEDMDIIEIVSGKATDVSNQDNEKLPYTPETRRTMYKELAEQKEEEDKRKRANMPRERDAQAEHDQALEKARRQEENGVIRQCNEAKLKFHMTDEEKPGFIILEVFVPKYLDSSLINVDIHPTYVTITIKNKLLRLRFPEEVKCDQGTALRSKTTGALKLTVEKMDPSSVARALRAKAHRQEQLQQDNPPKQPINLSLQAQVLKCAVQIRGIVQHPQDEVDKQTHKVEAHSSRRLAQENSYEHDMPPLLY